MATEGLSEEAERLARVHLDHCTACRLEHVARLRALRSGKLPRDVASVLPVPATNARGPRGLWDAATEWVGRPFTHDATLTGAQFGIAGRGLGSIAAAKLAALCIGGVSLVGGGLYCLSSPLGPSHRSARGSHPPAAQSPQTSRPTRAVPPDLAKAKWRMASRTITVKSRPRVEVKRTAPPSPTQHEHDQAVSPAPAGSAPNGASEFGPVATTPSTAPAKAVTSGGPEFP
jgi:hypothetical protein